MALETAQDYITEARVLLQDTQETYRYSSADMIRSLNMGLLEMRKMRPDLFLGVATVPTYTAAGDTVVLDQQYRMALLYYLVGQTQMRDEEPTSDSRAGAYMGKFTSALLTPNA